jgi:hypothetical protein
MPRATEREYNVRVLPRPNAKGTRVGDFWILDHFDATFEELVPVVPMENPATFSLDELVSGEPLRRQREAVDAQRTVPTVVVEVRVRRGRPECVSLQLAASGEHAVSATDLRMPLETMIRTAVQQYAMKRDGETWKIVASGKAVDRPLAMELEKALPSGRGRHSLTENHLRAVADVYRQAAQAGESPRRAIMARFVVSEPTAKRWIARAREGDYLPPGRPGKVTA